MLRFFVAEYEELNPFFDKCIQAGNVPFTLGIQVKEAKALLSNPQRYASLSAHGELRYSSFKKDPNLQTLCNYLAGTCISKEDEEGQANVKRKLEEEPKPKTEKQGKEKRNLDAVF